ncbi:MAG: 2-C-methyl-D-erythritol 2,4-cyclodiphosphate synthase [Lutispora sp.]|nr:2-C-methyl-D-erythritol 2,4-cyclodiphosphate synthase [Lutispora sp.]MDD4833679.1 2-C-methyl-D-erythritol 2,4-cyclodiphosphate synthase [Lutispora sp.]
MFRVGNGYDVHRLAEGRKLILGGVEIPFEKGLLGHSDADVLLHAIIDALLGACGKRDIGALFPDIDPAYKDISSMILLERAAVEVEKSGYKISNIDSIIVAEKPKLFPFIDDMRNNIGTVLGIEIDSINIKATTSEGLGFTGAGQGMASHAVVCLYTRRME